MTRHCLAALVCRFWATATRRCRFRVVEISFECRPLGNPPFKHIPLLCDPTSTVLPLVQERRLGDIERYPDSDLLSFNNILPAIRVPDLTVLQSLSFVDFLWAELSEESRCCLKQLCQRVTSLSIHVFCAAEGLSSTELIQLLLAGKSLRKVSITNSGLSGGYPRHSSESYDSDGLAHRTRKVSSIASIRLSNSLHAYLPALLATFSFPHLTEVIIEGITLRELDDVMSFLRACSSTVEHLRLTFGPLLRGRGEDSPWKDIEGT